MQICMCAVTENKMCFLLTRLFSTSENITKLHFYFPISFYLLDLAEGR